MCVCVCVYSRVQRTIYVTLAQPVARGQHVTSGDIWTEKTSFNPASGKAETEGQAILKIYKLLVYENIYYRLIYSYVINLLRPTGHVMHQQFNIQQLYVLPTLYLCVLYLSEKKQRLVPLIS